MSKNAFTIGINEYACCIRACIRHDDFLGAIAVLIEAQTQGVNFLDSVGVDHLSTTNTLLGLTLQNELAAALKFSVRKLDDFYFALVELVRKNYSVPSLALNAVVLAACKRSTAYTS